MELKTNACGIDGCVYYDGRICFGIALFDDESKADAYDTKVRAKDTRYNGGWFHGRPCGRDKSWDTDHESGIKLFAVTD